MGLSLSSTNFAARSSFHLARSRELGAFCPCAWENPARGTYSIAAQSHAPRSAVAPLQQLPSGASRPHLDSHEHGGSVGRSERAASPGERDHRRRSDNAPSLTNINSIRGGARLEWIVATSLYAVGPQQGIQTMMQIYASAARLRSSGAHSCIRHESHWVWRATATSFFGKTAAWSAGVPKLMIFCFCC
jgi:hypothetical protein